jgi:ribose 5-phosphate isomerase B
MDIFIGADHRGFALKEKLKAWLTETGHTVNDIGAAEKDDDDDYPPIAAAVAQEVTRAPATRGIVLCGSGTGVAVAANKIAGARAALIHDPAIAKAGRQDDDLNILALGADFIDFEAAQGVINAFLETQFSGEDRHLRRLGQIAELEK